MSHHTRVTIIRRSAAAAGLVLAIVGLLVCLAGIGGTWLAKARAQSAAAGVFTAADDALEFIHVRVVRVKARIDASAPRVRGLADWGQRLQAIELDADLKDALDSLREYLDSVGAELAAAERTLDPVGAVAGVVEAAATAMAATSVRAADVAELAGDVGTAAARLGALRARLLDARERRLLMREFAAACIAEAADLDTRLANLSSRIDQFAARAADARTASADTGTRVQWWIGVGAVILIGAFRWFAASQVCVLQRVRGARA